MEKPSGFVPVVPRGENPFREAREALMGIADLCALLFAPDRVLQDREEAACVRPCAAFLITELPWRREFARDPRRRFVVRGTNDAAVAMERCDFVLDEVPDGYEVARCEARSFDPCGMLVTFTFRPTQSPAWTGICDPCGRHHRDFDSTTFGAE
jgi:hypothetical protein